MSLLPHLTACFQAWRLLQSGEAICSDVSHELRTPIAVIKAKVICFKNMVVRKMIYVKVCTYLGASQVWANLVSQLLDGMPWNALHLNLVPRCVVNVMNMVWLYPVAKIQKKVYPHPPFNLISVSSLMKYLIVPSQTVDNAIKFTNSTIDISAKQVERLSP